jgi:hypothetical protein
MLVAALVAMSAIGSLEASAPHAADSAIASSPMQQARPVIMRSKPRVHEITLETEEEVEAIYRHYRVTHADVRLSVEAADPVDYEYDGLVDETPLNWTEIVGGGDAGR